jgi:hypothetical protein
MDKMVWFYSCPFLLCISLAVCRIKVKLVFFTIYWDNEICQYALILSMLSERIYYENLTIVFTEIYLSNLDTDILCGHDLPIQSMSISTQICEFSCHQWRSVFNNIQLFNGSAGNRSTYFSWGTEKDQSALLPEVNRTLWFFPIPREKLFDLFPALPLNNCLIT